VLDQKRTHRRSRTHHDLEHTLGNAGGQRQLGQTQGREWRQLGWLDHHRVATGQGGPDLPRGDGQGEIPGHDGQNHAQWFMEGQVHTTRYRDGGASVLVDGTGVEVQNVGHHGHFTPAVGDGLPHVPCLEEGQLVGVLLHQHGKATQEPGPVRGGDRPPGRKGGGSPAHDGIGLVGALDGHVTDGPFRRRVDHRQDRVRRRHACSQARVRSSSVTGPPP
jgi:hypothetical protein